MFIKSDASLNDSRLMFQEFKFAVKRKLTKFYALKNFIENKRLLKRYWIVYSEFKMNLYI